MRGAANYPGSERMPCAATSVQEASPRPGLPGWTGSASRRYEYAHFVRTNPDMLSGALLGQGPADPLRFPAPAKWQGLDKNRFHAGRGVGRHDALSQGVW